MLRPSGLSCVLLAGLLVPAASAQTAERAGIVHELSRAVLEAEPALDYDPLTLLVRFRPEQDETERAALRARVGPGRLRTFDLVPGLELLELEVDVETAVRRLAPFVEFAEPNWIQHADNTPNDTYFGLEWGMHNTGQTIQGQAGIPDADIDAVEAWDVTTGDPGFVVAIIDTGTDWDHPDLAANIWSNPGEIAGNGVDDDGNGYVDDVRGWDFYSNDANPDDSEGHGSHTAGTVGAVGNNGIGVAGVNWRCKLVPLRFLGPQGGFTSDAVLAVQYCTTKGIRVSNNSWGGGGFSSSLYNAIAASRSAGHVFVAAAGNDGINTDASPHYPSSYDLDNIVSVAAIDNRDNLASEGTWGSNYGATSVDLGAPGVDIASTWSAGGYVWNSGTSMATPHVTGVVSLVYAQHPAWSYSQVIAQVLSTVRPTSAMAGRCTTGGVLNAQAAVAGGGGGGDTTPPGAPTGLLATAGNGSVDLDWSDNGEPDLAGYRVYRSTTSGTGYAPVSGLLAASAFTDATVSNGTTYYYVVTAEDTSGNESGASGEASATPQSGGGGGQVVELFADGFESGLGAWSVSGSVFQSTAADQGGIYGARIQRTSWIERAIDSRGYGSIELSYARRTGGMDNGESLTVEYFNGTAWVTLESTRSTAWAFPTFVLGGDASDNANLRIRFRTNANRNNERADVDDVVVRGTTL